MSKVIKFLAYQKGTTAKGRDVAIAIEREAHVADTSKLRDVLGSVFAAAYSFMQACRQNGVKTYCYSLPVHLRFEFNGEIIDTASFDKHLAASLKVSLGINEETGKCDGFKRYAKRVWSFTMLETQVKQTPSTFISETGEVVPTARLLAAAKARATKAAKKEQKQIEKPVAEEEAAV